MISLFDAIPLHQPSTKLAINAQKGEGKLKAETQKSAKSHEHLPTLTAQWHLDVKVRVSKAHVSHMDEMASN